MGWWIASDSEDIEIGDEVLDEARMFLSSISNIYQNELQRKPTVAELEYLLSLSFSVNANSDILDGFGELIVKQVTIKTGKRAKRIKPKVGDIFSFRLDEDRYGFGRIVNFTDVAAIVELFDYFSEQPIFDYSRINDWLMDPITIDSHSLLDGKTEGEWNIIGETKNFTPDERFNSVYFSFGDGYPAFYLADIFGKEKKVSGEEAKKYRNYTPRGDFNVKQLINDYLKKRGKN